MKKCLSNIILFLFCMNPVITYSQTTCTNPAPPVMTLVSVQPQTGFTDFQWTQSPSSNVAAYLVYIFHNENGIPRGDIIDTLWDPAAVKYTYKSTVSSYYSVSFVMAAFRVPNCTSSFSNIINTLFANASIDTCNKKITISWNSYPSIPNKVLSYTVLFAINGSTFSETANLGSDKNSFSLNEFTSNAEYCFAVKANLEDGAYTTSNKICLSTKMQQPPQWINADYATIDEENNINLSFSIDPLSKINTYRLERKTENENDFSKITQIESGSRHIVYTDKSADPFKKQYYRLLAINNCGNPVVVSNLANNIVTELESNGNLINLKWNPYKSWRGELSEYKVYMDAGNGFIEESSPPATDSLYSINYSAVMYNIITNKLCFYIGAFEKNNPYGITGETFSVRVCTDIIERITIPNAFTPNNDLKNDHFKPVLSFTPNEYHLVITDKQNKILFESHDEKAEWDGKKNGGSLPEGVYLWFLKVKSPSGKVISKTGTVTILK
jgi:gliding motility-associated-like protein